MVPSRLTPNNTDTKRFHNFDANRQTALKSKLDVVLP